jgi:hypothetical protein
MKQGKGNSKPRTRCSCGFTEQPDENLTDHLLHVFTPEDGRGNDGLVHEEAATPACRCGYAAGLDSHFLEVFTPADGIGRDGQKQETIGVDL